MSIERRLAGLEARASEANSEWVVPIEVSVHCKSVERSQARRDGKEPPAYSPEEVAAMRQWDLENVAGEGFEAQMRDSPGWRTPGSQELLDAWEEATARMAR